MVEGCRGAGPWLSSWEAGNHVRTITALAAGVLLALGTARGWGAAGRNS